ncbi:MAG: hypothetical protein ABWY06_02205 [Pseudomonas sp.]|uniref:hypothetical protein n=1 Tax=Pseudomonas sp. TaxID=306 RepID=UPI003394783C
MRWNRRFFPCTLYIQVHVDRLTGLHLESGKQLSESSVLAFRQVQNKRVPLAIGSAALALAGQPGVTLSNGFEHPRTLLADFSVAEATLKLLVKALVPPSLLRPAPTVIVHLLSRLEGGLTQIEVRGFTELALVAGARKAYIWTGAPLSKQALTTLDFSGASGQLWLP